MLSTPAAASPAAMKSHVTASGERPRRRKSRVAYGDSRRTYSRPAQCSPLLRANISGGCVAARSSATEGFEVRVDPATHALLVEVQMLEDRVAVRPRAGRVHHRLCELVLVEPQVARGARQLVARQAGVDQRRLGVAAAEEAREEAACPGQLAVVAGAVR